MTRMPGGVDLTASSLNVAGDLGGRFGAGAPPQPYPTDLDYTHTHIAGACVTSIVRFWPKGVTAHCRLCNLCAARADHCLVTVNIHVAPGDMPLFSTRPLAIETDSLRVVRD